jgi:hypothetical protein
MTSFPGAFFQNPDAFEPRELEEEELGGHVHGQGCGHEAVPHDDHVDYVHDDGHHHFLKGGRWFHHHRIEDEATEDD